MKTILTLLLSLSIALSLAQSSDVNPTANNLANTSKNTHLTFDFKSKNKKQTEYLLKQIYSAKKITVIGADSKELNELLEKIPLQITIHHLEIVDSDLSEWQKNNPVRFKIDSLTLFSIQSEKLVSDLQVHLPEVNHLSLEALNESDLNLLLSKNISVKSVSIISTEIDKPENLVPILNKQLITDLEISNCGLTEFPMKITAFSNLKNLKLDWNLIESIDTNGIYRLNSLSLIGNPVDEGRNAWNINPYEKISLGYAKANDENQYYLHSSHPQLQKSFSNINVMPQLFQLSSNSKNQVETKYGGQFSIPENAFVDKNGNPVNDNVELVIREFNTPMDIIVAGIPMYMNQQDSSRFLVSDGMFEITAYRNKEELQLAPNKEIEVDYPSVNNRTEDTKFYELLKDTGEWKDISDSSNFTENKVRRNRTKNDTTSNLAVRKYLNMQRNFQTIADTLNYSERFYD